MFDVSNLLLFGLAFLPVAAVSFGRWHSTAFFWSIAAVVLWLTGLSQATAERIALSAPLVHVAGPVSAAMFLLGALRLTHRPRPPRLAWLGAIGGLAAGVTHEVAGIWSAYVVQCTFAVPMLVVAAGVVCAHAWRTRARLCERALGVAICLLAALTLIDPLVRSQIEAHDQLGAAWTTLTFALAFLLLGTLADRASERAKRLNRSVEEHAAQLEVERRTVLGLVDSLPLGVIVAGADDLVRYGNREAARLLDLDPEAAWADRDLRSIAGQLATRLAPGTGSSLPADGRSRASSARKDLVLDEGSMVVETLDHTLRNDAGLVIGRLWIGRDATEDRRMAERLSQAERMETMGTLAGGLAHDFNNQLTAIIGNLDLLRSEISLDRAQQEMLGDVESAALDCAQLTRGLLTFGHRRRGDARPVDFARSVQEVVDLLQPSLDPGVQLVVDVASETGAVLADRTDLRRVLTNLVLNARDAIVGAGTIRIEARRRTRAADTTPVVEFSVRDDGAGMDEHTRRHLFDPFFTTRSDSGGTGLGLAVTYGLAENHGATIDVESAPGVGSTFRLTWPAATEQARSAPRWPPGARGSERAGRTILLAEDDARVRASIRGMLEREGFEVVEAEDGPTAVARFRARATDIDLVLLDLKMPGFSGLEALDRIRSTAGRIPAILMSGNPEAYRDRAGLDEERLIMKPFRTDVLIEQIRSALDAHAAGATRRPADGRTNEAPSPS